MSDPNWEILPLAPPVQPQPAQAPAPTGISVQAQPTPVATGAPTPLVPQPTMDLSALNPDLAPIVQRESGGKPFVGYTSPETLKRQGLYTDLFSAPIDDSGAPVWAGDMGPAGISHAFGPAQIQPGTWRRIAKKLGITDWRAPGAYAAVANELYKEEGKAPWAASEPGGAGGSQWQVLSAGNWSPSPQGVRMEMDKPDTSVYGGSLTDYMAMTDLDAEAVNPKKRARLDKSLTKGDEVETPPEIEVKVKDGKAYVIDQDGLHRMISAADAGVNFAPIAFKGIKAGQTVNTIVTPSGKEIPFNLAAYPRPHETPKAPTHADEARQYREKYGILGGAVAAIGADIADIVSGTVKGMYEGAKEGGQDIWGVGPSQPGEPVSPAVLGTEMAFATTSPGMRAPTIPVPTGQPANALAAGPVATPQMVQGLEAQNAARGLVGQRYAQDLAGGGPPVADVTNQLTAARAAGQPTTLADLSLPNVRALLGTTYREGGPARAFIKDFLESRDAAAPTRAEGAIAKYMGTGTVKQTQDALIAARSAEARPLWDKAMAGGSIAPLEAQFKKIVATADKDINAAQKAVGQAEERIATRGDRISTKATQQFEDDKLRQAQATLAQAQAAKAEALPRLQQAQADGTAGAPGAVWSPRLQMFLNDPIVQQGIRRGWRIERLNALEENRAFSPTDYAVVGFEKNGDPIVGAVPNMRALAVAKEGLDAILDGPTMRTEFGTLTKMGRAVDGVRRQFLAELDRLNPDYKPARDAWSGKTSSLSALQFGKDVFNRKNLTEDIVQRAAEMTPNEKEFAKVGIAARMRENVMNVADAGDESKALANSRGNRERIRPFFRTEEDAGQFLDFVDRERSMFKTNQQIMGGSQTAERVADDRRGLDDPRIAAAINAGEAIHHLTRLNPLAAARAVLRGTNALSKVSQAADPVVNLEAAKIILNSNLLENELLRGGRGGADFLAQVQLPLVQNTLRRGMMNQLRRAPIMPPYGAQQVPLPPGFPIAAPPNYQTGQQ